MFSLSKTSLCSFILLAMLAVPAHGADKAFVVNAGTDAGDGDLADGICDTDPAPGDQGQCTLRAAIEQANDEDPATLHKITFSVNKVTLTADLPGIIKPTIIDGAGGGPRAEIDGTGAFECFNASSDPSPGGPGANISGLIPEANNSRFENLVIYGCTGLAAISLDGHGYVVSNNYIGTNVTGDAVGSTPNATRGIDVSASILDGGVPALGSVLPGDISDLASVVVFLTSSAASLPPTGIVGNVISGNQSHGIDIHGRYMATAVVFDNKIGVTADGTAALPNGEAGGSPEHGITINAEAYLNFIGLDNIIAGHDLDPGSHGILIDTGAVPFPNFVLGNTIGTSSNSFFADLGNRGSGITVATASLTTDTGGVGDPTIVNPTGLSAIIGPGNIVGYNGNSGAAAGDDPCDFEEAGCTQGGILVTNSNSVGVRIWGNLVGISDPSGTADIGNYGDGINVVGKQIEIGGPTLVEGNLIASNERHGLTIRGGTNTTNVTAHANYIGVIPGGAAAGNTGHGIWLRASGNQIGGPAFANERNTIAYNGGHGIKVDGGAATYGNLIQHNEIYSVPALFLPIDLDAAANAPDPTVNDPVIDRNSDGTAFNYANWQQNTLTLDSTGGAGTTYTLRSSKDRTYNIEFYRGSGPGEARIHLCDITVTASLQDDLNADPEAGMATGVAACAATGPATYITATVTDVTATAGAEPDRPGFPDDSPINNTSELSASALASDQVRFTSISYGGNEGDGTIVVTLQRIGSGDGAVSVQVVDLLTGSATAGGVDYTFLSPTLVEWGDGDIANKTVNVTVIDDAIYEQIETLDLQLQNPTNAELDSQFNATVSIDDAGNDDPPVFSINDVAVTEGTDATITFTVTKTGATSLSSSVNYAAAPGTALQTSDYGGPIASTLFFGPGVTTQTIVLTIGNDGVFEPTETFTVELSSPFNATVSGANGIGTGTINDDDAVTITISDVTAFEGDALTTAFTFFVSISNQSSTDIIVDWMTADGTASAGSDYAAASGTVTFPALGALSQQIVVDVNGDTTVEDNETFFVDLTGTSAGTITDLQGLGTIQNDDGAVSNIEIADASTTEGLTLSIEFVVTRTGDTSAVSTVEYDVIPGSAVPTDDYTPVSPLSGTLFFAIGETEKIITLDVVNDAIFELTETFTVELSNPATAVILDGSATGTILDDDAGSTVAIDDPSATEGTNPTITFTVTRSGSTAAAASVNYTVTPGSAGTPGDYTGTLAGTLNFAIAETEQTITLNVIDDGVYESTETFTVTLDAPVGVTIADASGTGTILDEQAEPTVLITDVSQAEGDATNDMTFAVMLSAPSALVVTVDYATSVGTADGTDFTATSGTVTFMPEQIASSVIVQILGDTDVELDETFTVTLSNPSNTTLADAAASGTILNDDVATPTFTISDVTLDEGLAGTTAFVFTVTLTPTSGDPQSVDVATVDGTATVAGGDYVANAATLNFDPGVGSQTFTVLVNGDAMFEADETFTVTLSNPSAGTAASGFGLGTITNDDLVPSVSIDDVTQLEGDAGTSGFIFTLTLSNPSSSPINVTYLTSDGSATSGSDYAGVGAIVVIPPGALSQTIAVTVNGDTDVEPNETFIVTLTGAAGATIADGSGTGTILDDDAVVSALVINDPAATEGTDATIVFTVTRTGSSVPAVTVDYAVTPGSATTPADYGPLDPLSGTLNFATGETSKTVTLSVTDDTVFELPETLTVTLSNPTAASITDASGTGTISDNDPQPAVAIGDVMLAEGDAGSTAFTFNVTLSNASSETVTVDFATADGTALAGSDYAASSGTVTFAPGEVGQAIVVSVTGDLVVEPDETFLVSLTNPVNATIANAAGTGTILDDDSVVSTFTIGDAAATEGTDATIVFTVTRTGSSVLPVTVDYSVTPGSAQAPEDYTALDALTGTLSFATGETSKTITLNVIDDPVFELVESFAVTLSNPVGGVIADGSATGTIASDDPQPTITISDATQSEGSGGTTTFTFTVTLSNPSSQPVSVNFATADGTATGGTDFTATSGTLTFAPGTVTQTISVLVNGDSLVEPDETFFVNLSGPVNGTIGDAQATGTITNNDAAGAAAADIPALGPRELVMLALLMAGVAAMVLRKA